MTGSDIAKAIQKLNDENQRLRDALTETEDRADRYFQALLRALPGHYTSVLWHHYTSGRWSISEKMQTWAESDKNTVGPFDAVHWLRVFGLKDGDWIVFEKDAALTPEGATDD